MHTNDNELFDWSNEPELNITPLVDIMLVLLAILMVTTPAIQYKEEINLPKGSKNSRANIDDKLDIRMDINRKIYIKTNTYDYDTFPDSFNLIANSYDKNTPIYIQADKKLQYQDIMYLLKSIKEAGFTRVSLVTN